MSAATSGFVGDSPVINASIIAGDATGSVLASTQSDSTSRYSLTLDAGTAYPITINAQGGTNQVTGIMSDFTMSTVVQSASNTIANIGPFSTLIMKTAQNMPGNLTALNLEIANEYITRNLNFGLDRELVPNPITAPITDNNIATFVKASTALTEWIRRTQQALGTAGIFVTMDQVIDAVAADMADGSLDGTGAAGSDPRIAATANVISAQILLELAANNLVVNGVSATSLMDNAIRTVMPTTSGTTADIVINNEMLSQIDTALRATQASYGLTPGISTPSPLAISNTTPQEYVWDIFDTGSLLFSDQTLLLQTSQIPPTYQGLQFLRTPSSSETSTIGSSPISFDVNIPVSVYVAHADNIPNKPAWLGTWEDTGDDLLSRSVYRKDFQPGAITLGSNMDPAASPAPAALSSAFTPIRINAGGPDYIDSAGNLWSADYGYNVGYTGDWGRVGMGISAASTTDPDLYQTERWISHSMPYLEYAFSVPNGDYQVTLHFVDHVFTSGGIRVADVVAEGQTVLSNVDTAGTVGQHVPLVKSFPVTVQDGQINIRLERVIENPNIAAIEIEQRSSQTATNPGDMYLVLVKPRPVYSAVGTTLSDLLASIQDIAPGTTSSSAMAQLPIIDTAFLADAIANAVFTADQSLLQSINSVAQQAFTALGPIASLSASSQSVNYNDPVTLSWSSVNAGSCSIAGGDYTANAPAGSAVTGPMVATQTFVLTCQNGNGQQTSRSVTVDVAAAPEPQISPATTTTNSVVGDTFTPIRINAGGPDYIDSAGKLWSADIGYNIGYAGDWGRIGIGSSVASTTDPDLYRTERWISPSMPNLEYDFSVPDGDYQVTLHFVDHVFASGGMRVTDVVAEGQPVLSNVDAAGTVGQHAPLIKSFPVSVQDGQLNIRLQRVIDNPNIAAIEVSRLNGSATTTISGSSSPSSISSNTSSVGLTVNLAWIPNPDQIDGYQIYVGTTSQSVNQLIADIAVDATQFNASAPSVQFDIQNVLGLVSGQNACFAIRAYNAAGLSPPSNAVCQIL